MSADPIQALAAHWQAAGARAHGPASDEELRAFEERWGVQLPPDLRNYFRTIGGMSDFFPGDRDAQGFALWSLARVRPVSVEARDHQIPSLAFDGADQYFVFADYLDWSWAYAIRLTGDHAGTVATVAQEPRPVPIANSFTDFLTLYLADSPHLYG